MTPRAYSDAGVVLARRNYGEADRILSLFSQNHGRITVIAKGIRKPASRKRGHLEVFSRIKFQAVRGKSLDLLTEAETIENYSLVRKNLTKTSLAYFFLEVIGRTTREGEPHPELFALLVNYFENLGLTEKLKTLRNDFVIAVLVILGFWPKGKPLNDPDAKLEEVTERNFSSLRVGKRILTDLEP